MQNISIQTTQNVKIEYELASLRDRILAYLLDFLVITVAYIFILIIAYSLFPLSISESGMGGRFLWVFLPIGGFLAYQFCSEVFNNGQSVGKKTIGIKVMRVDGREPSLSDYLLRTIFLIIDVMLSFGTIAMILINSSAKGQRLGDIPANTTVIKVKNALQFRLEDILKINTLDNYEPMYPQVKILREKDMLLIKNAIIRLQEYPNDAHRKAIFELTEHVKNLLEIDGKIGNQIDFLKTLIRDYIVLTR